MDAVNTTPFSPAWFVTKLDPQAFSLVVVVKGTFRLVPGKAMEPAEEQQPPTGDVYLEDNPQRPLVYGLDFAPYKPKADVVLSAQAWAPGGVATRQVEAGFQVGRLTKSLRVHGDRYWLGRREASPAKPFVSMPITWEGAFGGQGFALNPLGRGAAEVVLGEGVTAYPAPNIEFLSAPQKERAEKVPPAGFGPIPSTWPQRAEKTGKYDKRYLKERWPYYPEDFDWGHFNFAPADQQLEGYLQGDEEVLFRNLHPRHMEFRTRMPGIRLRCFLDERIKARQQLREVPMKLDTFWADPAAEIGVLVWRGNAVVRSEKFLEVTHLLVASEKLQAAPAPLSSFDAVLSSAVLAGQEEEEEEDLEPEEPEEEEEEEEEEAGAGEGGAEAAGSEEAGGGGSEGGEAAPESTAGAEGAPEAESGEPAEPAEPDPDEALTLEQVKQRISERASFQGLDLSGLDLSGLDFSRLNLREAVLEGAVLASANLAGADLTGALLGHANLGSAHCSGAVFAECDLTHAWLDEANLEGATLVAADLTSASLRRANLRRANATEAVFCEADLSEAVFQQAKLTGADLCDARMHRTNFTEADLSEAALERAWGRDVAAEGATFHKLRAASSRMPGANFSRGRGEESVWELSELAGANFQGAVLRASEFSGSSLGDAVFDAAEMRESRLIETRLPRARLRRTNLLGASLEKADLSGADLSGSNLYEATLMDADVRGTNFQSANLRRVRARKE